jgi:hypothetical protein
MLASGFMSYRNTPLFLSGELSLASQPNIGNFLLNGTMEHEVKPGGALVLFVEQGPR